MASCHTKGMETKPAEAIRQEFSDSYNLGRALAIIDALLRYTDDGTRDVAEKFLTEMDS